jgi:hypothetical protein
MDKHMVTDFSSLDLHLGTKGHVFGAIVLYLLGLDRIRNAIRNLKIVLLGSEVIYQFAYTFEMVCMCHRSNRHFVLGERCMPS